MAPDPEGSRTATRSPGPAGATTLRDRVRRLPRPGAAAAAGALAILLLLMGLVTLLHPVPRALVGGAPGVVAALAGGALLFVLVDPLGVLLSVEGRVLGALLETLFPATADAGGDPVDVAERLHRLLPSLPLADRLALRGTAWLILFSPLLVLPSLRPFTVLDRDEREAVTRAWATTRVVPLRAIFTLVKGTLAMVHFEREAVLEEIGWTPADSGYGEG